LRLSLLIRQALFGLSVIVASVASAQGTIQVPTVVTQVQAVGAGFELDGVIEPVKQSTISAQAGGRIATMQVKAGDKVRAGQLLATIDDREALTGVERSQAQAAQAQAELRNAQSHFDRTRDLQSRGFVSAAALDSADSQLKSAKAGRDQASAGAKQSALAQGFTRVSAPFEGWVLQTQAEAGDLAVPGKPLMTIYAPEPLRVVVQVPVSRSAAAQAAGSVEVAVTGADGERQWVHPASRSSVPTADPVSQTIEWRLALPPETGRALLPGQQVRVRFASGQHKRMVVPQAAVLRRGELTAVYVASGKQFVLKAIRLGADQGPAGVEVLVGLTAGERVALDPVKAGLAGAQPAAAL
jgi:RND family efflux transporter MFP subunit